MKCQFGHPELHPSPTTLGLVFPTQDCAPPTVQDLPVPEIIYVTILFFVLVVGFRTPLLFAWSESHLSVGVKVRRKVEVLVVVAPVFLTTKTLS